MWLLNKKLNSGNPILKCDAHAHSNALATNATRWSTKRAQSHVGSLWFAVSLRVKPMHRLFPN